MTTLESLNLIGIYGILAVSIISMILTVVSVKKHRNDPDVYITDCFLIERLEEYADEKPEKSAAPKSEKQAKKGDAK